MLCLVTQSCPTLCESIDCSPPSSSVLGEPPGKYRGVDCHALLQGIFPTQGLNTGLLPCRSLSGIKNHEEVQLLSMPAEVPHVTISSQRDPPTSPYLPSLALVIWGYLYLNENSFFIFSFFASLFCFIIHVFSNCNDLIILF